MENPALLPLTRTPRLPAVDWTDVPADLNGLVRFAERWNLISARVPSHFNWPLTPKPRLYPNAYVHCHPKVHKNAIRSGWQVSQNVLPLPSVFNFCRNSRHGCQFLSRSRRHFSFYSPLRSRNLRPRLRIKKCTRSAMKVQNCCVTTRNSAQVSAVWR